LVEQAGSFDSQKQVQIQQKLTISTFSEKEDLKASKLMESKDDRGSKSKTSLNEIGMVSSLIKSRRRTGGEGFTDDLLTIKNTEDYNLYLQSKDEEES
jgi:hypothetical protein